MPKAAWKSEVGGERQGWLFEEMRRALYVRMSCRRQLFAKVRSVLSVYISTSCSNKHLL